MSTGNSAQEELDRLLASAKWSEAAKSLREISLSSRLPTFAKVARGSYKDAAKQSYDHVLVHSVHRTAHVIAEGFRMNGKPAKERFSIPLTYGGWLEVMSEDLKHAKPITSIAELIQLAPKSFLVRSELKVVYSEPGCDQVSLNKVKKVAIGEKLHYCEQFQVDVKSAKKVVPRKFIRCKDSHKNNIFIDVDTKVQFNSISDCDKVCAVHSLKDILTKFRIPVMVHIIDENMPAHLARSFLPVFRLLGVFVSEIVHTSPLKLHAPLISLPSSTPLHLFEIINSKGVKSRDCLKSAVKHCGAQISADICLNIALLQTDPDPAWIAAGNSFLKGLQSKYKPGLDTISDKSSMLSGSNTAAKNSEEEQLMLQEIEDIYRYVREGGDPPPSRVMPPVALVPAKLQTKDNNSERGGSSDGIYHDIESIKNKKVRDSMMKSAEINDSATASSLTVRTHAVVATTKSPTSTISAATATNNITPSGTLDKKNTFKIINQDPVPIEIAAAPFEPVYNDISATAAPPPPPSTDDAPSLEWMKIFKVPEYIVPETKESTVVMATTPNGVQLERKDEGDKEGAPTDIRASNVKEIKHDSKNTPIDAPPPPPLPPPTPKNIVCKVNSASPPQRNIKVENSMVAKSNENAPPTKPKAAPPPPKKSANLIGRKAEDAGPAKQLVVKEDIVSKQKALFGQNVEKSPFVFQKSKPITKQESSKMVARIAEPTAAAPPIAITPAASHPAPSTAATTSAATTASTTPATTATATPQAATTTPSATTTAAAASQETQRSTKYIYKAPSSYDVIDNMDDDQLADVTPTTGSSDVKANDVSEYSAQIKVNGYVETSIRREPSSAKVVAKESSPKIEKQPPAVATPPLPATPPPPPAAVAANRASPVFNMSQRNAVETTHDRYSVKPPFENYPFNGGYPYLAPPAMAYPPFAYNTMPYYPPNMMPPQPSYGMMNPYPTGMGMPFPQMPPNFYGQFTAEDFTRLLQMKQTDNASEVSSFESKPRPTGIPGAVSVVHVGKTNSGSGGGEQYSENSNQSKVGNTQVYVKQSAAVPGISKNNSNSQMAATAAAAANFSTKYNYTSAKQ